MAPKQQKKVTLGKSRTKSAKPNLSNTFGLKAPARGLGKSAVTMRKPGITNVNVSMDKDC